MVHDSDFEDDNDEYILIPKLKDLQTELLEECIKAQIADPHSSSTNFIEPYHDDLIVALKSEMSDDTRTAIMQDAEEFYTTILMLINNKFNLDIDMTTVSRNNDYLVTLTDAIYQFFIIDYVKNIKKFFVKFITQNQSDIAAMFDSDKKKDVSTTVFKKKLLSKNMVTILSNIDAVLSYIYNLNIDAADFIDFFNQDRYEVKVISDAIDDFVITGDFVQSFLSEIGNNQQTGGYDIIILKVQNALYDKNKRLDNKEDNDGDD